MLIFEHCNARRASAREIATGRTTADLENETKSPVGGGL